MYRSKRRNKSSISGGDIAVLMFSFAALATIAVCAVSKYL